MIESSPTLLLAQSYEPIQIISWQRAISLLFLAKVEIVEEYDACWHSPSVVVRVPAVVRLRSSYNRRARPVKFSRVNIYARDGYRCQYCGVRCGVDELTYDHVMTARAGWSDVVGEHRVRLLHVQSPQGESHAGAGAHEAPQDAGASVVDPRGPDPREHALDAGRVARLRVLDGRDRRRQLDDNYTVIEPRPSSITVPVT